MAVRAFYGLPAWYLISEEEEKYLDSVMRETRFNIIDALFVITLDCGAMCNGCLFCASEDFKPLPACRVLSVPRRD